MTERMKQFISRQVFHPLEGMALGEWYDMLRRHRFAIGLRHWPRVLIQTGLSLSNSVGARIERLWFGRRIEAATIQPPLFILGHYRSGTTHLQNVLALDPQFATPSFFQVLNPHTFLTNERWASPIADALMVSQRFQDEVALGSAVPGEDEIALGTMTGLSPYLSWSFPGGRERFDRYTTFEGVPEVEVDRWKHALTTFLKKVTLRQGRPLILKSPPHTARIRLLLELFPDARFIHIHRDPYAVFRSTRHMIRAVHSIFRLQECPPPDSDDEILDGYTRIYDAYFEQRTLIPSGRLVDVGFGELERDPVGLLASIYGSLGLPGFDALQPRLERYLATIQGYRKNRLDELCEPSRGRIAREWGRSFDEWGYPR